MAAPATNPGRAAEQWVTLIDARRHFRLEYPGSWKANTEVAYVAHYSAVFLSLNSAGKEGLIVREVQTRPDTWELNPEPVAGQVPPGTAYLDVSWFDGPVPQFGAGVHEMEGVDLSGPLKGSIERRSGELVTRSIRFSKWGRHWNVTVYVHQPATAALCDDVQRVLESFRFEGLPIGDEIWAIGLALRRLPAEADPEMYTREGGSSEHYCAAKVNGQEVTVTFTKHVRDTPAKSWNYRVTAMGEVIALGSD